MLYLQRFNLPQIRLLVTPEKGMQDKWVPMVLSWRWHEIFLQVLPGCGMKILGEEKNLTNLPNFSLQGKIPLLRTIFQGTATREHGLNCMFICKAPASTACLSHLQAYLSSFLQQWKTWPHYLKSHLITCSTPIYMYILPFKTNLTTVRNRFLNQNAKFIFSSFFCNFTMTNQRTIFQSYHRQ